MQNGLPFSILIVEDDADDRMFINEAFVEIGWGAEVKKFIDGPSLLHYLGDLGPELYPHLIVLDNGLPGMDAREILSQLKKSSAWQQIPVVIYTSLVTSAKREELMGAGALACIEKGRTMEELRQVARDLRRMAEESARGARLENSLGS